MDIEETTGIAVEEDEWLTYCPNCEREFCNIGYFDPDEITECKCGCKFKTTRIEFEDGSYII